MSALEVSPSREERIGQLIEAVRGNERSIVALSAQFDFMRKEFSENHRVSDNRANELNEKIGGITERIRSIESRLESDSSWRKTAAAILVTVCLASVTWGGWIYSVAESLGWRVTALENQIQQVENLTTAVQKLGDEVNELKECLGRGHKC